MIPITSLEDPRVASFVSMRARKGHLSHLGLSVAGTEKIIVAEGTKGVRALLEYAAEPLAILAESKYYGLLSEDLATGVIPRDKCFVAEGDLMRQVVGYKMHQGVMALAKIPEPTALEDLPFPILTLNSLTNAENVGAIIRNAVAFGVRSILMDSFSASPFLRRSVKVAMGAIYQIKWHEASSLLDAFATLKQRGGTIIGAEVSPASISCRDYEFPTEAVLVMGSEGSGISPELKKAVDVSLTIPISPLVESLNVAAASAVLLYRLRGGG